MVNTLVDASTLKLTVDKKGIVWCLNGEGMPYSSNLSDWDFLHAPILQETKRVRVSGSADNAELIHQLYELKLKRDIESLQVCSPGCCAGEDRNDPAVTLFKMRDCHLAASVGGWHEFGLRDYPSYLLAAYFNKQQNKVSDYSRQATYSHPAWPAISFIEHVNIDAFSKLVALLIDPRWFVDVCDIDSNTYLEQFLGLTTRNISSVDTDDKDPKTLRCRLVLECWKTAPKLAVATPRSFLWRAWADKGGGTRGDLIASRLFISFLRLTWTKLTCTTAHAGHLFVPKYFFVNEDEIVAYEEHERDFKARGLLGDIT